MERQQLNILLRNTIKLYKPKFLQFSVHLFKYFIFTIKIHLIIQNYFKLHYQFI
jgi:hypothetical protein